MFSAQPSPTSWAALTPENSDAPSPADEAAQAQQAREAAALRQGRRGRAAVIERSAAPEPNPQDSTDSPGFRKRTWLGFQDSYYRGTLLGAARLASLAHLAATPDAPDISPERKRVNDDLRQEYRQIVADLARYDRMRSAGTPSEYGAATLGQVGGMLSPESWLGLGTKGANWLWRAIRGGLQQGAANAVTDPVVQGLNINAGVRDRYDPWQTLMAGGAGVATGAAANSLAGLPRHERPT